MRLSNRILWVCGYAFLVALMARPLMCYGGPPMLTFISPGSSKNVIQSKFIKYSSTDLERRIPARQITFFDPIHRKRKRYEALPLKAVLDLGFGARWRQSVYSDMEFVAVGGSYQASTKTLTLKEDGGFLVIRDLDDPKWEAFEDTKVQPGPFYVVWMGADQTQANEYLWFWQLMSMRLLKFEDLYPKVIPVGADTNSDVYRGYELFKGQCFRCHAMGRQGGKIGPDLNAPKSIISYRSKKMIKAFVREPSKYRYTTMPDNPYLSDSDLDDLMAYFRHQDKHRSME